MGVHPREIYGTTHFLRIPLSTIISRPQIYKSYKQAMNNPVASGIPKEAFLPHSQLHINLGQLDLDSDERYNAAIRHLQNRNLEELYQGILKRRQEKNSGFDTLEHKHRGILADFRGIANYSNHTKLDDCMILWAPVIDHANVLSTFCYIITLSFWHAGLLRLNPDQLDRLKSPREPYTNLIATRYMDSNEVNYNPELVSEGNYRTMRLRFNATGLWREYFDFPWARNFQLEKLSICEMGLKNIYNKGKLVGAGYKEVANVPLPGASSVSTGPDLEGETMGRRPKVAKPVWAQHNTPKDHNYRDPYRKVSSG